MRKPVWSTVRPILMAAWACRLTYWAMPKAGLSAGVANAMQDLLMSTSRAYCRSRNIGSRFIAMPAMRLFSIRMSFIFWPRVKRSPFRRPMPPKWCRSIRWSASFVCIMPVFLTPVLARQKPAARGLTARAARVPSWKCARAKCRLFWSMGKLSGAWFMSA